MKYVISFLKDGRFPDQEMSTMYVCKICKENLKVKDGAMVFTRSMEYGGRWIGDAHEQCLDKLLCLEILSND